MPGRKEASNGRSWALAHSAKRRGCGTCAWGRGVPKGLRWIDEALGEVLAKRSTVSLEDIAAEAHRLFEYPYPTGLKNHKRHVPYEA